LLIDYLAKNYKHSSRGKWEFIIGNGQITIDGQLIQDINYCLKENQLVEYFRLPWVEPLVPDVPIEILFQDEHVMVINKPGMIPVLPGGCFYENTILHRIKRMPNSSSQGIYVPVHRLGLSGIIFVLYLPLR